MALAPQTGDRSGMLAGLRLGALATAVLVIGALAYTHRDEVLGCGASTAWARKQPCAPSTPLEIFVEAERRVVGEEQVMFIVSGRILNRTTRSQSLPPIEVDVLGRGGGRGGDVVGGWNIAPPVPALAPGQTASFSSTQLWSDQAESLELEFGGKSMVLDLNPRRPWFGSGESRRPRSKVVCSPVCAPVLGSGASQAR